VAVKKNEKYLPTVEFEERWCGGEKETNSSNNRE
jgi:hypothetical protein